MKRIARIFLKTLTWLVLLVGAWQLLQPLDFLGRLSLYNRLFPGRERLPFGETPQTAYNFSLNDLNAMFASHRIAAAGPKSPDRFRIVVIGDSSAWGTLLRPEETLAAALDGKTLSSTGQVIECYNLAYPTLSLTKDLLLLDRALAYGPDLILWSLTMEAFPDDKQFASALAENNIPAYNRIAEKTGLPLRETARRSLWEQRRDLADLIRLQAYGFMWAGTGIDQDYPQTYEAPRTDLDADNSFHGVEGVYPDELLRWDVLEAGAALAGDTPLLVLNEPMLISDGENADIRYNYYYPREAYDAWRETLHERVPNLLDAWDLLPAEAFTNSAIHYRAESSEILANSVIMEIDGTR